MRIVDDIEWVDLWRNGFMEEWIYGGMNLWRDGFMEGWIYGGMDLWRDGTT